MHSGTVAKLHSCKVVKLQRCKVTKLQKCKVGKLHNCKVAKLQRCKVANLQRYKRAKGQRCELLLKLQTKLETHGRTVWLLKILDQIFPTDKKLIASKKSFTPTTVLGISIFISTVLKSRSSVFAKISFNFNFNLILPLTHPTNYLTLKVFFAACVNIN